MMNFFSVFPVGWYGEQQLRDESGGDSAFHPEKPLIRHLQGEPIGDADVANEGSRR